MNTPTIEKTWQFDVNQTASGGSEEASVDACLLAIKNSLKGFGTLPWTVWGSCDGSNVDSGGGTDYWIDAGDLVHNNEGLAHSWIVLNSPNGSQMCFTCNSSSAGSVDILWSPQGLFTGGTTTATPTASDQFSEDFTLYPGPTTYKIHILHSTDGYCTRIFNFYSNICKNFVLCDMAKDPATELSYPLWVNTGEPNYGSMNDYNNVNSIISGDQIWMYCTSEAYYYAMIGELLTYADDDIGSWYMSPMGLFNANPPHRGRKGSLYDMWWGATALESGTTYPGDGSKQYAQFGDIIVPWNGTTPQTA